MICKARIYLISYIVNTQRSFPTWIATIKCQLPKTIKLRLTILHQNQVPIKLSSCDPPPPLVRSYLSLRRERDKTLSMVKVSSHGNHFKSSRVPFRPLKVSNFVRSDSFTERVRCLTSIIPAASVEVVEMIMSYFKL